MKTVYHAQNVFDAYLVRGLLEQEGIQACVIGEYLTGALGELPAWGLVTVQVADEVEEPAGKIVALLAEQRAAEPQDEQPVATSWLAL